MLHSRWVGVTGYLLMAVLLGTYLYQTFWRNAEGGLNISCFAYRDVNRNGRYDMDDRPYAGLSVVMTRPDGRTFTESSNLSGFANFVMSRRNRNAVVRKAGDYVIDVVPAAGWIVTSGATRQTGRFVFLPGTPAGIVAERGFEPVGIARDLMLSGSGAAVGGLTALDPRGVSRASEVTSEGRFQFLAERGVWTLLSEDRSGRVRSRTVKVGNEAVVVSRWVADDVPPLKSEKRVVDFDTLTPSDTLYEIPRGYGGLEWINWVATHHKFYKAAGFVNGTVSGEYSAYNSSGHPARIESDVPFDVIGLRVGVVWPEAEKHEVVIRAWRGPDLIHEDQLFGSTRGSVYFDADYRSITRFEIGSAAYWQVVVDDFEYRVGKP